MSQTTNKPYEIIGVSQGVRAGDRAINLDLDKHKHIDPRDARLEQLLARISELESALREIAKRHHADTCSHLLIESYKCDCHVSIARQALRGTNPQLITCPHGFNKTERCEACVNEGRYTYAQPIPENVSQGIVNSKNADCADDESVLNDLDTLLEEVAERR